MANLDEKISSKQIILDAAREEFAEKGFDGARVDEIAKRAGVNKALIYYYFESKDKILEELSEIVFRDLIDFKANLVKKEVWDFSVKGDNNRLIQDMFIDKFYTFFQEILSFSEKQKDILSIVMIEALKGNSNNRSFFEMLNMIIEDGSKRMKEFTGAGETFDDQMIITMVFFAILPFLNLITLGAKWSEFNHIDNQVFEENFKEVFQSVYSDFIIQKFFQS